MIGDAGIAHNLEKSGNGDGYGAYRPTTVLAITRGRIHRVAGVELDLKPLTRMLEVTTYNTGRAQYYTRPDGSITNW